MGPVTRFPPTKLGWKFDPSKITIRSHVHRIVKLIWAERSIVSDAYRQVRLLVKKYPNLVWFCVPLDLHIDQIDPFSSYCALGSSQRFRPQPFRFQQITHLTEKELTSIGFLLPDILFHFYMWWITKSCRVTESRFIIANVHL